MAISTSCCSPTRRLATRASGSRSSAEAAEQIACGGAHALAVDHQAGDARLAAEKDVVGDGELGNEVELLVDDGDALRFGVAHARKRNGRVIDGDLALIVGMDAGQDLHERRLAGAVFAHQRMDLAAARSKRYVLEGGYAAELLR